MEKELWFVLLFSLSQKRKCLLEPKWVSVWRPGPPCGELYMALVTRSSGTSLPQLPGKLGKVKVENFRVHLRYSLDSQAS